MMTYEDLLQHMLVRHVAAHKNIFPKVSRLISRLLPPCLEMSRLVPSCRSTSGNPGSGGSAPYRVFVPHTATEGGIRAISKATRQSYHQIPYVCILYMAWAPAWPYGTGKPSRHTHGCAHVQRRVHNAAGSPRSTWQTQTHVPADTSVKTESTSPSTAHGTAR